MKKLLFLLTILTSASSFAGVGTTGAHAKSACPYANKGKLSEAKMLPRPLMAGTMMGISGAGYRGNAELPKK